MSPETDPARNKRKKRNRRQARKQAGALFQDPVLLDHLLAAFRRLIELAATKPEEIAAALAEPEELPQEPAE